MQQAIDAHLNNPKKKYTGLSLAVKKLVGTMFDRANDEAVTTLMTHVANEVAKPRSELHKAVAKVADVQVSPDAVTDAVRINVESGGAVFTAVIGELTDYLDKAGAKNKLVTAVWDQVKDRLIAELGAKNSPVVVAIGKALNVVGPVIPGRGPLPRTATNPDEAAELVAGWTAALTTARDAAAATAATATGPRQQLLNDIVADCNRLLAILARNTPASFALLFAQPNGPAALKQQAEVLAGNAEHQVKSAYTAIGVPPPVL
jgi:hypothetical protein